MDFVWAVQSPGPRAQAPPVPIAPGENDDAMWRCGFIGGDGLPLVAAMLGGADRRVSERQLGKQTLSQFGIVPSKLARSHTKLI
jgi:hypothetical protein